MAKKKNHPITWEQIGTGILVLFVLFVGISAIWAWEQWFGWEKETSDLGKTYYSDYGEPKEADLKGNIKHLVVCELQKDFDAGYGDARYPICEKMGENNPQN